MALSIQKSIVIQASAYRIWKALTDPQESRAWISTAWPGLAHASSGYRYKDPIVWHTTDGFAAAQGVVFESRPYTELEYSFRQAPSGSYQTQMVQFTLEQGDRGLFLLHLKVEGGWNLSPDGTNDAYEESVRSWNEALPLIKTLAETSERQEKSLQL